MKKANNVHTLTHSSVYAMNVVADYNTHSKNNNSKNNFNGYDDKIKDESNFYQSTHTHALHNMKSNIRNKDDD